MQQESQQEKLTYHRYQLALSLVLVSLHSCHVSAFWKQAHYINVLVVVSVSAFPLSLVAATPRTSATRGRLLLCAEAIYGGKMYVETPPAHIGMRPQVQIHEVVFATSRQLE